MMLLQFMHSRLPAFRHAFRGLGYVLKTQKNAWIHSVATLVVIGLGLWLNLDFQEWVPLVVVIGLVWLSEAFNTAVEVLTDLVSPEPHPMARVAKDTAAAAVLLAALTSVVIGLLVLGPPILERLF
jgi:diacylglycerol kinase (ATP)